MKNKKIARKIVTLATISALCVSCIPMNVFAYGEYNASESTFKSDTDNSTDFRNWKSNVWETTGLGEIADSGKVALTPGKTEQDLNFAWYSETKGNPAVMVWKDGQKAAAKIVKGAATEINAENWQGNTYTGANKVSIENYFKKNTKYYYQYTDNYIEAGDTEWSQEYSYTVSDTDNFSVILTGDPQIGASGSSTDNTAADESVARDTYNWNLTVQKALQIDPDAAFLLSAGDQIDKTGATSDDNKKTRESEYAGYLYPSVFRSLPVATTIGNHDMNGIDYSNHFNNPNSSNLGATAAGGDYYFTYGDVLFISLNSNNRNQQEHRALMEEATKSSPDAVWKVVIFHSDIYGSGQPHADTDASTNRIIFAPLMDEFDIDICLTGHDHTYSRSYQILDGNVVNYDLSDGSVTDPEGTLYITTGSGSGSKYYNLLNYTPYYIAERTNECLPAFSTIDFSSGELTIKTYDYTGAKYADDFTIIKTDENASVEDVIEEAEKILRSDEKIKYTQASLLRLQTALDALKEIQETYTTAEDLMIGDITTNYGTENDRISGYGSIKNNDDKYTTATGSYVNRLKEGISTLLDKTIYLQINEDVLPIVSSTMLLEAKGTVLSAINTLELAAAIDGDNTVENETTTTGTLDEEKAPQTGDGSTTTIMICLLAMALSLIAGIGVYKRKEENCEE